MGKLDRVNISLVGALCCACACSSAPAPEAEGRVVSARQQAREAAERKQAADPRFDAEGRLKPSGERMSWLELPSGFRRRPGSTEREASFEAADMPFAKVREYLEARIVPDSIDYRSNGTSFRSVLPSHTRLTMAPLHVTLLETDRKQHVLRLSIEDLTPPTTPPLSDEAAAQELARMRTRME
jgi:hypothetical protein